MNMKVNEKQQNIGVTSFDVPARGRSQTPPAAKQKKPIAPQSDPFADALREAMDADSDVERANSGRARREGVKNDDGLVAQDVSVPDDGVRSDTSQDEGRQQPQSKRVQERERAEQAHPFDTRLVEKPIGTQTISPVEQQNRSILATVSLDNHSTASFLMQRSFQKLTNILENPVWRRNPQSNGAITIQQMLVVR